MDSNALNIKKKRYEYIDILRILGCLLVIYIHTYEHGYNRYATYYHKFTWAWDFFLSDLVQAGVPLFLAISGALLLGKDETIKQTYKRIPKFLINLILFSFIYIYLETKSYGKPVVPLEFFTRIFKNSYLHLWYLYAHIALIISLPFLRPMVKGLNKKTGTYLLAVASIFAAIVPIFGVFGITFDYRYKLIWMNMIIFIYPIEGYIIDRLFEIDKVGKKHLCFLIALTIFSFIIDILCGAYFFTNNPNILNESFLNNFNILKVALLFLLSKKVCCLPKLSQKDHPLISEIGACTFGIYLIHIFILDRRPIKYLWYTIEETSWGQYIGVYISCIGTFAIAGIIIYVAKKIPLIKNMF